MAPSSTPVAPIDAPGTVDRGRDRLPAALSENGGRLLFQLISARHERGSTILTTNKGFEEWGSVLGDKVMATAMLDRLLHRCHSVNIQGASYRMRGCLRHQRYLIIRHGGISLFPGLTQYILLRGMSSFFTAATYLHTPDLTITHFTKIPYYIILTSRSERHIPCPTANNSDLQEAIAKSFHR